MLVYTMSAKRETLPSLDEIGYTDDIDKARFGPGQRNRYTAHYIIKGKGYFNGRLLSRGDGFLVSPGMFEEYYPDPKDPWGFLWFSSPEDSMSTVYQYYRADENAHVFRFDPNAVEDIVQEIIRNGCIVLHSFQVSEIFLRLFYSHINPDADSKSPSISQIYVNHAVNYIKSNLHLNITVNDLTQQLGISQPHLYRLFQSHLHMSPKEYILHQKINSAQKMLLSTSMTVNQIAHSVGYEDALAFSRIFSKKTGMAPQKYRNCLHTASEET